MDMYIEKKVLRNLSKCYSVAPLRYKGQDCLLVAAEKKDPCLLFDIEGNYMDQIWETPGGTMTMVQIPGSDGQFLAVHQFYSPNDSAEAKIVLVTPPVQEGAKWSVRTIVDIPFVHRFDILERDGHKYLFACTLKSGHDYKDDWSHPGRIYATELPENLDSYNENNQLPLTCIKEGLGHNHGYTRDVENGVVCCIVSCDQGVFRFTPPQNPQDSWKEEQLLEEATSDAILIDLNGDGVKELVSISPFHGDSVAIYEQKSSKYTCVYPCPTSPEFAHAICAGTLCGKPVVIIGHRGGARNLLALEYGKDGYNTVVLDRDVGPANALLFQHQGRDVILSANRETDEIALYHITKGE